MNAGAGVTSLSALNAWYAALASFRTDASNAVMALNLTVQRANDWLSDQQHYWQHEIRACEDEVAQAKAELRTRKFANYSGERPDCSLQEENLRKAQARLHFAEDRLDAVRRWIKRLPVEIRETYDSPVRRLGLFLDVDLAQALAQLSRQLTALEQYTAIAPPSAPVAKKPEVQS
jgi:hypothetical protein